MNLADLIDNLINKIDNSTGNFSESYLKEIERILKKSGKDVRKAKSYLDSNSKIDKAKHLYLVDINKMSLELIETMIDSYAKKYGIQKGRILFARDIKVINEIYIKDIDKKLEQVVLDNMSAMQFTADRDQVLVTVSNQIGKSIAQTRVLMEEALVTANRDISNRIFKNIEAGFEKAGGDSIICYEYSGVRDSLNRPFCAKYIGKVMTRKQWEAIEPNIFVRMGGWNCRHSMEIADCEEKK